MRPQPSDPSSQLPPPPSETSPTHSPSSSDPLEHVEDIAAAAPGVPIEEAFGPQAPDADPAPAPKVEPYTEEEILGGTAVIVMLGLRLQDEKEVAAFQENWNWVVKPVLPTAGLLRGLKVGEALASYGIGRGMVPGAGNMESLPPWLRLILGGALLAVSGFSGVRAVQQLRLEQQEKANAQAA